MRTASLWPGIAASVPGPMARTVTGRSLAITAIATLVAAQIRVGPAWLQVVLAAVPPLILMRNCLRAGRHPRQDSRPPVRLVPGRTRAGGPWRRARRRIPLEGIEALHARRGQAADAGRGPFDVEVIAAGPGATRPLADPVPAARWPALALTASRLGIAVVYDDKPLAADPYAAYAAHVDQVLAAPAPERVGSGSVGGRERFAVSGVLVVALWLAICVGFTLGLWIGAWQTQEATRVARFVIGVILTIFGLSSFTLYPWFSHLRGNRWTEVELPLTLAVGLVIGVNQGQASAWLRSLLVGAAVAICGLVAASLTGWLAAIRGSRWRVRGGRLIVRGPFRVLHDLRLDTVAAAVLVRGLTAAEGPRVLHVLGGSGELLVAWDVDGIDLPQLQDLLERAGVRWSEWSAPGVWPPPASDLPAGPHPAIRPARLLNLSLGRVVVDMLLVSLLMIFGPSIFLFARLVLPWSTVVILMIATALLLAGVIVAVSTVVEISASRIAVLRYGREQWRVPRAKIRGVDVSMLNGSRQLRVWSGVIPFATVVQDHVIDIEPRKLRAACGRYGIPWGQPD